MKILKRYIELFTESEIINKNDTASYQRLSNAYIYYLNHIEPFEPGNERQIIIVLNGKGLPNQQSSIDDENIENIIKNIRGILKLSDDFKMKQGDNIHFILIEDCGDRYEISKLLKSKELLCKLNKRLNGDVRLGISVYHDLHNIKADGNSLLSSIEVCQYSTETHTLVGSIKSPNFNLQ